MPDSILGRGANPGLLLHEWTKNFRGGQVYEPAAGERPGAWVERLFPASEGEDFAPRGHADAASATASPRSCLETFARRLSVRRYADAPLTRDELARLLSLCHPVEGADARGRGGSPKGGGLLRSGLAPVESCKLLPLVVNVEGLGAGAYLYDEGPRRLRLVRAENPLPLIVENFFQAEFTHAPVLVLLVGSLAESLARYGDRGYRLLLMEAGLLIQRLYLAASSLGLAGCITGSLIQPRFNEWLGLDGFNGTALLAFAAGRHSPATSENV
jgi:SagB-type dehydrogenase family enzyme